MTANGRSYTGSNWLAPQASSYIRFGLNLNASGFPKHHNKNSRMIPDFIADLARLIWPEFDESDDEEARGEVIASAWRVHRARYRRIRASVIQEDEE